MDQLEAADILLAAAQELADATTARASLHSIMVPVVARSGVNEAAMKLFRDMDNQLSALRSIAEDRLTEARRAYRAAVRAVAGKAV